MNARRLKLPLVLGTLALTTNCTTTTNAFLIQKSQKVPQIGNTPTSATTRNVRIDGSITVYPITKAIAQNAVPKVIAQSPVLQGRSPLTFESDKQ